MKLNKHATGFLSALVRFSEPLGATTSHRTKNLVNVEYDDEAMFEALAGRDEEADETLG
ncbi:MAG: hypothetical protein M3N53_08790 [Actinomycetota bacterium]|nr:hypothetical protein [Actinomycetota bacterium]